MASLSEFTVISPGDLRAVDDIDAVLATPDSAFRVSGPERRPIAKVAAHNLSGGPLRATSPVFLPLKADSPFPERAEAPAVYFAHLKDVTCYPDGIMAFGDAIYSESFRREVAAGNTRLAATDFKQPTVDITEPCLYFDGEFAHHFGHFLAETFSRLWVTQHLDVGRFRLVSGVPPQASFVRGLLGAAGVGLDRLVSLERPVRCRSLLIPSPSHVLRTGFSSIGQSFYGLIAN